MILFLALLAAIGCAIFNGIAAILEKTGASKHAISKSVHFGILWKLRKNLAYVIGIILDLLAWILTLIAVHNLPLFLVQPIIACSIIVTLLIERFLLKHKLTSGFIGSVSIILFGLILLAISSSPEKSQTISHTLKWLIVLGPILLLVLGAIFSKVQKHYSTLVISALSGIAFGGVSIAGRVLVIKPPYIHIIYSSLMFAIIAYGLIGILFFTMALQRTLASVVSSTMIASETLIPIIIGIGFLGDHPRHNLWPIVYIGIVLTLTGTILISLSSQQTKLKN
jgi:drug/metabolite transporter (DMT)-like permease